MTLKHPELERARRLARAGGGRNQPSDRADDATQEALLLALERGLDPLAEGHRFAFNKARELKRADANRDHRQQRFAGHRVVSQDQSGTLVAEHQVQPATKNWLRNQSRSVRKNVSDMGHKAKRERAEVRWAQIAELILCGATLGEVGQICADSSAIEPTAACTSTHKPASTKPPKAPSITCAWKATRVMLPPMVFAMTDEGPRLVYKIRGYTPRRTSQAMSHSTHGLLNEPAVT